MSTNNKSAPPAEGCLLTLRDLAGALIKHYGLHEGYFELMVEFQVGTGGIGPEDARVPGAMIGLHRVGLKPTTETGSPTAIDAAEVNPRKAKKLKSST